jgi:Ca2+-transporting ATPase
MNHFDHTTLETGLVLPPYRVSADSVVEKLQSHSEAGLTEAEARRRLKTFGPNLIDEQTGRPLHRLVINQFKDLLIAILIVATILALYLGDVRGATILIAIILINAAIGFVQEFKADRLLEKLQALMQTRATVIRDGVRGEIRETQLVPGDIVVLEAGDAVPADIRLLESHEFATNDFILTGESLPQDKDADLVIDHDATLPDQDNTVFFGTSVARGSAIGIVCGTGKSTAIGDIAELSQTIKRDLSPLQLEINSLARTLGKLAAVIVLFVFATNILLRADAFDDTASLINASLLFAIGVAAACVPQGLPAQITVALSLGVGRLAREQAIVKRLSAVETLGSTTVICSDKTGTITSNEMTIVKCWSNGRIFEVGGDGYDPVGEISENGAPLTGEQLDAAKQFFQHGMLASNGRTHPPDEEHLTWYAVGDPTEAAFMPLAIKAGLDPEERLEGFPVVEELPFDSRRKRMTILRQHKGKTIGYMKGATESVLEACNAMHRDGTPAPLDRTLRQAVMAQAEELSAQSLRVIALAYRDFPDPQNEFPVAATESDFVFAGLVAMHDPPRPGVADAVQDMHDARVRVFMLTGDDPITAAAIGQRIGVADGTVLTGDDLRAMPDSDLRRLLTAESVIFSRVSPTDKLRIVTTLRACGEVVAVTGDGVNDALSLKRADIGVAMGRLGSDVAKEAAEIVLLDDDFTTLVQAVREGRTIFQNLRSVILSSITSNIGELSCVCLGFIGVAFGLPLPITAVQILSVDLIGEMLPLMALTFDPPDRRLMHRPPRKLGAHIVDRDRLLELILFGTLMGAVGYGSFYMVHLGGGSVGSAQAAAYLGIVLTQYANILSRRTSESVFRRYLFANRQLLLALLISLLAVLFMVTVPAAGIWFGFEPLQGTDWLWPVAGAFFVLFCFEIKKLIFGQN